MRDDSPFPAGANSDDVLFVCSYQGLEEHVPAIDPGWLISILGPEDDLPWPWYPGLRHLKLSIDDVSRPLGRYRHATEAHIRMLLDFLDDWGGNDRLLIHCWAGQSRSPAAALVALAMLNPERERDAACLLRERGPHTWPNELIIRLADDALGCNGRLVGAVDSMPDPDWYSDTDLICLPAWL